jgi:hypothetical protein
MAILAAKKTWFDALTPERQEAFSTAGTNVRLGDPVTFSDGVDEWYVWESLEFNPYGDFVMYGAATNWVFDDVSGEANPWQAALDNQGPPSDLIRGEDTVSVDWVQIDPPPPPPQPLDPEPEPEE